METLYDVIQLLKKYGIFIYIGNRLAELTLMEEEIKELHQNKLISNTEYTRALLVIKRERRKYS